MNARMKKIIFDSYRQGKVGNTKDIMDLALRFGVSYAEIYRFLCKEERSGSVCAECVHIGTNKCLHCARNENKEDYYEPSL